MKRPHIVFLALAVLGIVGCSASQKETKSTFTVSARSLASAGAIAKFPAGLLLYGRSGDRQFGKVMTKDSLDHVIPNGDWEFFVIGWDGNDQNDPMTGKVYCAYQKAVLDGEPVEINLVASNSTCQHSAFGKTWKRDSEIVFPENHIQSCRNPEKATSSAYDCAYDTSDPINSYRAQKGAALSYQIHAVSFQAHGQQVKWGYEGPSLSSACIPFSKEATGVTPVEPEAMINIPLFVENSPFAFAITQFMGSDECFKDYGAKDTLVYSFGPPTIKDYASFSVDNRNRIYLKASFEEACELNHRKETNVDGNTHSFSGGAGTPGHPFVLCDSADLVEATSVDYKDKNFILGRSIDLANTDVGEHGYFDEFWGVFDGNNRSIKNLRIVDESNSPKTNTAFIKTLTSSGGIPGKFINAKFLSPKIFRRHGHEYVQERVGIIGTATDSLIHNIEVVNGKLDVTRAASGMVVAVGDNTTIDRIYVENANIKVEGKPNNNTSFHVGGIVGQAENSSDLSELSFSGKIEASQVASLGGVAGSVGLGSTIEKAVSRGSIGGKDLSFLGGVVGVGDANVKDVYSSARVHHQDAGDGHTGMGGLFGRLEGGLSYAYFRGSMLCEGVYPYCADEIINSISSYSTGETKQVWGHEDIPYYIGRGESKNETFLASGAVFESNSWRQREGRYPKLSFEKENECDKEPVRTMTEQVGEDGKGSAENPAIICTLSDFKDFAQNFKSAKHYALKESLSLGEVVSPGDTGSGALEMISDFNASLDGEGHILHNLSLKISAAGDTGLFANIDSGGTVKNLKIYGRGIYADSDITQFENVGYLAGQNFGAISNVSVEGHISLSGKGYQTKNLGMIVGRNSNIIANSWTKGNISLDDSTSVGGLVGVNVAEGEIYSSSSLVNFTSKSGGEFKNFKNIGGFTGENLGIIYDGRFRGGIAFEMGNSVNIGLFTGENIGSITSSLVEYSTGVVRGSGIGGFVGNNINGAMLDNKAYGQVTTLSGSAEETGGFAGKGEVDPSNLYWLKPLNSVEIYSAESLSDLSNGCSNELAFFDSPGSTDISGIKLGDYIFFDSNSEPKVIVGAPSYEDYFVYFPISECPDSAFKQLFVHTPLKNTNETGTYVGVTVEP